VVKSIRGHLRNQNPSKALVLSFHGWTGCGKNFVSKIIAKNLFQLGMKSNFVHLYVSSYHFPHVDSVELYKVSCSFFITCLALEVPVIENVDHLWILSLSLQNAENIFDPIFFSH